MAGVSDLASILRHFRELRTTLPDQRKPNNNTRYTLTNAVLNALAMFFMQSPSFLSLQRALETRKGQYKARILFGIERIPSDKQIRKLLDRLAPEHVGPEFCETIRRREAFLLER
jgi:hypothetical protein